MAQTDPGEGSDPMTREESIQELSSNPKGVRFAELVKICDQFFERRRQKGTSHIVYRTPWPGDPRINIQNDKGMAKPYQVRQVIKALEKLGSLETSG